MTKPLIAGELFYYPLAPLTSWRVGGNAARFYNPDSIDALAKYIQLLPQDTEIVWLGLGSNVLVRDEGIQGAVICTRQLQKLYQQEDGSIVAQAGVTCAKLARFASRLGFPDAAFFAGIPGTVGGALAMNAGAFGGETWEWVERVSVIDRHGERVSRFPKDYQISYRTVLGIQAIQSSEAFVEAVFRFPHTKNSDGIDKIRDLLRKRSESQPIGTFNCGSVYRNPPGEFAARLIEACQLKGVRIGDAMVSPKHANFIINCGAARSRDIELLMTNIESSVKDRFGIALHPEVRILGAKE